MYQWISWHQPTEDHRPLAYPPNAAILGWWCSGYTDDAATLCALVEAPDEPAAQAAVLKDWPEAERWRFCEQRETAALGDRFRPTEWMLERMPANAGINRSREAASHATNCYVRQESRRAT